MSDDHDKLNETPKIKNLWWGSQCQSESPSSSLKESGCPSPLTRRVGRNRLRVALKFTRERLSEGSEAPRIASSQHTPNQLIPLPDSLIPLVLCPKVGTFGCQDH